MGIKCLNRYLTQQCQKTSITKEHISYLKGKKIAIDTSIYLYKYRSQDSLQESFYNMQLIVTNEYNCTDTIIRKIDTYVYLDFPNAFSPNGDNKIPVIPATELYGCMV